MIAGLQKLSKGELLKLAAQYGVIADKRFNEATIIQEIITKMEAKPMRTKESKQEIELPSEPVYLSIEDVELMAAKTKELKPEFQTIFDEDEKTVHLRYRGSEESVSLGVPKHVMKKRIEAVSRGALSLRVRPEFQAGAYKGYADTVLA